MITDSEIKVRGIDIFVSEMGEVLTERFISLILKEPFDYTKWQQGLFKTKNLDQLSNEAMEFRLRSGK
ncbi:MAG: hypothetical protein K9H64_12300 [Bacteroidales bacterium]|nr:hypothetical protein [Bacteroidales bacterium]MCF8456772.1 hypothetical protein [Bacteroidales bacterium]